MSTCEGDDLVIVSTTGKIDARDWCDYVLAHWPKLMGTRGSRLLVLAGIHGKRNSDSGDLGERDQELWEDCEGQIEYIREERQEEIEQNDIKVELKDASQYVEEAGNDLNYRFNQDSILKAIEKLNPTVVVLAFCFSYDEGLYSDSCRQMTKALKRTYISKHIVASTYCKKIDEEAF